MLLKMIIVGFYDICDVFITALFSMTVAFFFTHNKLKAVFFIMRQLS